MRRSSTTPFLLGAALTAVFLVPPASADWLVTRDGARIETRGPWKVDGARILFNLPNGTLSTLRTSEVDLDASSTLTAAAKAPRPAAERDVSPTAPTRPPVMVLTNKDIRRASEPATEQETQKREKAPRTGNQVEVASWESRDSQDVDGLEIVGSLKNNGVEVATNISMEVTINDQQGEPILDTTAFLRSNGLAPGKSTTFRALLPGVFSLFVDPSFTITSSAVTVQGLEENVPQAEADGAAAAAASSQGGEPTSASAGTSRPEATPPGVLPGVEPTEVYEEETPPVSGETDGGNG